MHNNTFLFNIPAMYQWIIFVSVFGLAVFASVFTSIIIMQRFLYAPRTKWKWLLAVIAIPVIGAFLYWRKFKPETHEPGRRH